MWRGNCQNIRSVAELLVNQSPAMISSRHFIPPGYNISRTHSINLITDEFLSGYMQDGRMSVVRRFFCLFVGFDLFLVSLLWIICIMINGDSILEAFDKQVVHYTFATSLFDVVIVGICRFTMLMIFYAFLYLNHWCIIALSTSSSCVFLIWKIFLFNWVSSEQQVFEVVLIIISAILAWGEAWFLDCRVLPQERHARHYFSSLEAQESDRPPLVAPLLASQSESRLPESVANFYSPLDTAHHSDDEDLLDDEYHQMALECVNKAYELLKSADWKVERVTKKGDTIYSLQREKLGKIFKLTGSLKYSPKALCEHLFYQIEDQPLWNPNMLESKIIRKINSYTDIVYQVTVGGSGSFIKRDFVNLRCWRQFENDKICEDNDYDVEQTDDNINTGESVEGSISTRTDSDTNCNTPLQQGSVGTCIDQTTLQSRTNNMAFQTLSKSLGAKDFISDIPAAVRFNEIPSLEEEFVDANTDLDDGKHNSNIIHKVHKKGRIWVSAAISVDYHKVPISTKYTRAQNLVAGFAMHEIEGKRNACIFEWILCLDLKGYIPRSILDTAYKALMADYMTNLRKHIKELHQ